MVIYQMYLSLGGLADFVLRAPRPEGHFFAQNREGVLGVAGFLCLYLIGEQIGTWTIWRIGLQGGGGTKTTENEARAALWRLVALDSFLWAAALASSVLIQPVSRRLVNMPYILWAAAHNVLIVTLLFAMDQFASMAATSQVLSAVNRNQLAFFILANLLTGAINLSMRTIYVPAPVAVAVVLGYMLVLLLLAVLARKSTLKFW